MGGFGFAQPLQRRLPMVGMQPAAPAQPASLAPDPGSLGDTMGHIRSGLQRLGIGGAPTPGMTPGLPMITAPAMPSTPGVEDPSGAISGAVSHLANGFGGAPDALADAGPGIGDFLAAFFGG